MLVDLWTAATSGTLKNMISGVCIPLIVDQVDAFSGTVSLKAISGDRLDDGSGTEWDGNANLNYAVSYVFPCASAAGASYASSQAYRIGHFGLESWIKSTGQILSATAVNRMNGPYTAPATNTFDVDVYPRFKSKVVSNLAAPLTDEVLNKYIGAIIDACGVNSIDTMITTRGVVQKYLQQPGLGAGRLNYDRTGKALNVVGGWKGASYMYEGQEFDLVMSSYCQTGLLYGLKTGEGNLKRYVPPRAQGIAGISGPGTGIGMDSEIEFINPMGGINGIFSLAKDSNGRITPLLEAPFEQYSQVVPIDVRGLKIAGITELTG